VGGLRLVTLRSAAPIAFLALVTIAVLVVRSGHGGAAPHRATSAPHRAKPRAAAKPHATARTDRAAAAYYRIQSGDTLDAVARHFGTSVDRLLALNPGIEPTALHVGQRVRIH
jgi:LysM repeat protein